MREKLREEGFVVETEAPELHTHAQDGFMKAPLVQMISGLQGSNLMTAYRFTGFVVFCLHASAESGQTGCSPRSVTSSRGISPSVPGYARPRLRCSRVTLLIL